MLRLLELTLNVITNSLNPSVNTYTRLSDIEFKLTPVELDTLQALDKARLMADLSRHVDENGDNVGIIMRVNCAFYGSVDGTIARQPRFILNDNYRFIHKSTADGNGRVQFIRNIDKQTATALPTISVAMQQQSIDHRVSSDDDDDAMDIDIVSD